MATQTIDLILAGLMRRYQERVPDVTGILDQLVAHGHIASTSEIENDHIAFRTMGVPQLGMQSLEKIFLHHGYEKRDPYYFERKKLDAFWYSPPREDLPRVFLSELRVGDLSDEAQAIIRSYTDEVESDPVDTLNLDDAKAVDHFLHSPLWRTPTIADHDRLAEESEYAAWVIYNRYYLNHFTISVHGMPEAINTIEKFNRFVEANGFQLNDSGGKSKTSADGLLIQSSTVAKMVEAEFDDGNGGTVKKPIAGSYVEFAERKLKPEAAGKDSSSRADRRDGFEAGNADKIFESTYLQQTKKSNDN